MRRINALQPETRRNFLAALAFSSAAGLESAAPRALLAQTNLTPHTAIHELLDGNQRFAAGRLISSEQDLSMLRRHTLGKQEPFAAILSCADSRVPPEIIFDQSIGRVFVIRVAGNIVTPEILASLEYGTAVLEVKAVLVLGHLDCGAVKAALQNQKTPSRKAPGHISTLYPHIQPALSHAAGNIEAAIKANAEFQRECALRESPVISGAVSENKLEVVAGYYDLSSGRVTLLDPM